MNKTNFKIPSDQVSGLLHKSESTSHFWYQRLTSVGLIILLGWFVYALFSQIPANYKDVISWIKGSFNTTALISLTVIMIYHNYLGWLTIIKDYIHQPWVCSLMIIILKILSICLIVITIITIIRIHNIILPSVVKLDIDFIVPQGHS